MKELTIEDVKLVTKTAGTPVREPERSELKKIYSKLEYVCQNLPKDKFNYKIRKDPRNQGGGFKYFQDYLWAKIFPKEFENEVWNKLAIILGIANNTLHLHIMGIGKYQDLHASKIASNSSWEELDLSNLQYHSLVKRIEYFYEKNRNLFVDTAYQLGLKNFKQIKSEIEVQKLKNILEYKKQIILQGPPGTGKTREAKLIAKEMLGLAPTDDLKDNEQFKLIQFHPSYTYEDFVRGIVAESKDDKIEYKNVNKTLGEFAEVALKNYTTSKETGIDNNLDSWIDTQFELFKEDIKAQLPENEIPLSGDITIYDVADNSFKYGKNWKTASHILFGEFKSLVRAVIKNEIELSNKQMDKEKFRHAHYRYTYYNALLEKFFQEYKYESSGELIKEKKYILVIDEINRANLSSVLGELIYALEYRNESVHSPYGIKDENNKVKTELILPPNLYIIGTMNTADRSVGHIDYAIRRRFAFVEVLPEKLEDNDEIFFNTSDFIDVAKLFIRVGEDQVLDFEKAENSDFLSDDFSAKDVALGHSYFIADKKKISEDKKQEYFNMKMKYEVIPILNEYLKDGVFNEKATVKIKEIEQRFA